MKPSTYFLLLLLLVMATYTQAQQTNLPAPAATLVNNNLSASAYEFSALAKWHNKILLVPQNRKHVIDSVFMLDSAAIEAGLKSGVAVPHTAFHFTNLQHHSKDSLYINNILLDNYDGIEAAVVKEDTLFLTLETDTSFGYVIKGIIDARAKRIMILPDTLHIPNTYAIDNAGYESLACLPGRDELIAFFECNKDTLTAKAWRFNTALHSPPEPVTWERPLYFRLTDVYPLNNNQFIGINHLFISQGHADERDAYISCAPLSKVEQQLTNGGTIDTCFTQVIKITLQNNKLNWQPVAFISLGCADNYEGIVPFKTGVLMIVDGEPGLNPCKLVYVNLK